MGRWIRNLGLGVGVALLAYFGVRALVVALASAETKIRWVVEDMVAGFNEARVAPVLGGVAREFVDPTSDVAREDLHRILAWMILNETDDQGAFLWSASFDPADLAIRLAEDEESADADVRVLFFLRRSVEPELVWDARISGTLALGEDGWQWTRVTRANHGERRR